MTSPDSLWTFFLHSEDEVQSAHHQSHQGLLIMTLDGMSRELGVTMVLSSKNFIMKEICSEKGITHTFSAPRTPHQNGVVERNNKTLIEVSRTMLEESKFPTYFWAEAIDTSCYTQNISIINQAQGKTPLSVDEKQEANT